MSEYKSLLHMFNLIAVHIPYSHLSYPIKQKGEPEEVF